MQIAAMSMVSVADARAISHPPLFVA